MWQDTAITPKLFWNLDAKAGVFLFIFFMHISETTFIIAISAMMFFSALVYFNIKFNHVFSYIQYLIAGKVAVNGTPGWRMMRRSRH